MGKFLGYRCSLCGTEFSPDEITYTCPKDGGNVDVVLDYEGLKNKYKPEDILSRNDPSLWRYLPLVPVSQPEGDATPLHAVGGTPVFNLSVLAQKLGLQNLWLKDESRNHNLWIGRRNVVGSRPIGQCANASSSGGARDRSGTR